MPIDVDSIPVDHLLDRLLLEVDQINTAVTLTLLAAPDNRTCDELDYRVPNPFRRVSQIVRGRSWALILW